MYLRLLRVGAICTVLSGSTVTARHMAILVYPFLNTGAEKKMQKMRCGTPNGSIAEPAR